MKYIKKYEGFFSDTKMDYSHKNLISLSGLNLPEVCDDSLLLDYNRLTSLEGCSKTVTADFYCNSNRLTSLEFGPSNVSGNYNCSNNKLVKLSGEDSPITVEGNIYCDRNNLTLLMDAPKYVGGNFYCRSNNIPEEEIERYRASGAVKGKIYSDYDRK